MLELQTLDLHDYTVWKNAHFEFQPGLTRVVGDNRSGKSVLMKSMKPALFGSELVPQGGKVSVTAVAHGANVVAEAHRSGKSNRYNVALEGKNQHTERIADGRDLIASLIAIPESLFDATILLDGTEKHQLARGKSSDRLDWLYEILAFANFYETLATRADVDLKALGRDVQRATVLREQLRALRPVVAPRGNPEAYRTRLTVLQEEATALDRQLYAIEAVLNVDIPKPRRSATAVQTELETVDTAYLELLERVRRVKENAARADQIEEVQTTRNTAKRNYLAALQRLGRKPRPPAAALPKLEQWLSEAQRVLAHATEHNAVWESQEPSRTHAALQPTTKFTLEQLPAEIEARRETIAICKRTLRTHAGTETTCPTCGSDLSDRVSHAADAQAALDKATRQLTTLTYDHSILTARVEVEHGVGDPFDETELQSKTEIVTALRACIAAAHKFVHATERLADMGEVDTTEPPSPDHVAAVGVERRELQAEYVSAVAYEGVMRSLQNNEYVRTPRAELRSLQRDLTQQRTVVYEKIERYGTTLVQLQTAAALHAEYTRTNTALMDEYRALRSSVRMHKVLKELRAVFGRDGLPAARLSTGLELFVEGLNDYAPLVWDETFKFEVNVGPRRCDIIAHRNRSAGTITTFSGQENRGWQLVSALALLRILPPSSRCDTIILDEIEANSDNKVKHRLVREAIPEICKMVPKVVVISPMSTTELPIIADREYRIDKRAGASTLTQTK